MARNQKQREASEFEERVVFINRVSKTVKGGRRMSLVALVVVGDGKGNVGLGMGKSAEVPLAISKASLDAKKNMFHVPVTEDAHHSSRGRGSLRCWPRRTSSPLSRVPALSPVAQCVPSSSLPASRTSCPSLSVPITRLNIIKAACRGPQGALRSRGCRRSSWYHRFRDVYREGEVGMANTIKIRQIRSTNGCKDDQVKTVRALGLHRIREEREITDNESVRGMLFKVKHLVEIVEE